MEPFVTLTGVACVLAGNDINTDQIAPATEHGLAGDHGKTLFYHRRFADTGEARPDFVLNQPQFRSARILVTGRNFGCGSSRESAVWALTGFGIRCVVAESFADIFRENCIKNSVLPVTLPAGEIAALTERVIEVDGAQPFTADLENRCITCPGGTVFAFDFGDAEREILMKGMDEIDMTLAFAADIERWEAEMAARRPWLQTAVPLR